MLVSATAKEISTPPAPAGFAKVTGNDTVLPGATTVLAGTMIGGEVTVTLALALEYPGALAMMVVDPADIPVTVTTAVDEPAAKLAVGCTVATPGLVELKLTVNPEAAGADRIREKVLVPVPAMVALDGEKLIVPVEVATCTTWLAEFQPLAEAVMVADPLLTPVT